MNKQLQNQIIELGAEVEIALGYVFITVYSNTCRKKVEEVIIKNGYILGEWDYSLDGFRESWDVGLHIDN